MLPLYRDAHFTFRFSDDRIVPRFHLSDVEPGTPVAVFALDAGGTRGELIAAAVTGTGGWVDLGEPIVVRAGAGFVVVPEENR